MDENRERERERERESSTARNEANKEGLIVSGIVKWARVGLGEESSGHRGHILRVHAFYSKSTIVLWVSHTHKPVVGSRSSLHARTHCVHHSTHTHTQTRTREVTRVRTRSRIYWPCSQQIVRMILRSDKIVEIYLFASFVKILSTVFWIHSRRSRKN